ncbi:MAG: hypothetical protein ABIZ96_06715 [Gemmatimonadales bacterium]
MVGCGSRTPPVPATADRGDECRLSAGSAETSETLTVALADSVDPAHAPIPVNDSERLLFRQYSETLVRLDCQGEVRAGLASAWMGDSTGQRWTFTLRQSPDSPDRTPPTATGVVSSWHGRHSAVDALGIDSAVALDDGRLRVTLRATADSAPRLFADPALAVPTAVNALPESILRITSGAGTRRIVAFQIAPQGDPRDALDRGADLIVTRDPAVVDYVANRAEFTTFSLPWSRTYVLLQPAGALPIWILVVDSVGRSLARDVAQADARAAEPSVWRGECTHTDLSHVVTPPISPRIVYPRDDKVARGLAERIVALTRDSVPLRSAGLDPAEFAAAVRSQGDRGYVLGLPRQVSAPCHELAALPAGARIQPLVDTRAHAIVRRGVPPLTVEWDGTLRVVEP